MLPRALRYDYEAFQRMDIGDPNKTYKWLRYRMDVYRRENLAEKNKEAIVHSHALACAGLVARVHGQHPCLGGQCRGARKGACRLPGDIWNLRAGPLGAASCIGEPRVALSSLSAGVAGCRQ